MNNKNQLYLSQRRLAWTVMSFLPGHHVVLFLAFFLWLEFTSFGLFEEIGLCRTFVKSWLE